MILVYFVNYYLLYVWNIIFFDKSFEPATQDAILFLWMISITVFFVSFVLIWRNTLMGNWKREINCLYHVWFWFVFKLQIMVGLYCFDTSDRTYNAMVDIWMRTKSMWNMTIFFCLFYFDDENTQCFLYLSIHWSNYKNHNCVCGMILCTGPLILFMLVIVLDCLL